ncbi:MAG: DUF1847 domain-containing protein [Paludibacter sp.]
MEKVKSKNSQMEKQKELYSESDLKLMRAAEDSLLMGKNRVEELKLFAQNSGVKRIGIAHCVGMTREAQELKARFADKFEVYTVDCKYAKIKGSELLNVETVKGTSCNPAGQADYLAQNETDLNISFGLCVGHDILFNMKSKAPTTTLVVKDREHKHNPYQEFVK